MIAFAASSAVAETGVALGKRLYWQGRDADNRPVTATVQGDVRLDGEQVSCVSCHRPSGFGASEGGGYVPPIAASLLFKPRELNRNRLFGKLFQEAQPNTFAAEVRQPRMRPAYDRASLARALREGVDAAGRDMDRRMPRFDLGERDVEHLWQYLQGLSAHIDPGVDAEVIHFATVVGPGVDATQRQAMLDTLAAYFNWMNAHTEGDLSRPNFSPYYHSDFVDSYRKWQLHVWELKGEPTDWPRQLEAAYARQPVFAMVSGLIRGAWTPVGQFCNAQHLPCIFPNAPLPSLDAADYDYTLNFSRGAQLEAAVMVDYLRKAQPPARLLELHYADEEGRLPAARFVTQARAALPATRLESQEFTDVTALSGLLDAARRASRAPDVLVVWPGIKAREVAETLVGAAPTAPRVLLASTLLEPILALAGKTPMLSAPLFVHPYELPTAVHPLAFRVRGWMHARGLDIVDERLQFQTYFAVSMVEHGLRHILSDFYRDYFIENIEHEAENDVNPGMYPRLALGPGQRFASKGAYVVTLDPSVEYGYRAVSRWLVP